jgi:acetyl-CoA acetyltransferase family protein
MDEYAARSHRLAHLAQQGMGASEIVPVENGHGLIERDETIRPTTNVDDLAMLKPSFVNLAMAERFPEISWSVTAGNSSQNTDGAAALLIMSERVADDLGRRPRARFVAFDVRGDDPLLMLTAPVPATRRVLAKSGMTLDQIDHYEVNEAFASVPLMWEREFGAERDKLNPCGGAIALGHPLGASGARLMTTMLNSLERSGARYGLQAMCEAGGMANATIIERL